MHYNAENCDTQNGAEINCEFKFKRLFQINHKVRSEIYMIFAARFLTEN